MSYLRKIEYTIIQEESFKILKNCSGCGCKAVFHNTNCFRVNANGNKIDIWLKIYSYAIELLLEYSEQSCEEAFYEYEDYLEGNSNYE